MSFSVSFRSSMIAIHSGPSSHSRHVGASVRPSSSPSVTPSLVPPPPPLVVGLLVGDCVVVAGFGSLPVVVRIVGWMVGKLVVLVGSLPMMVGSFLFVGRAVGFWIVGEFVVN